MDREKVHFAWWYYFWLTALLAAVSPFFHDGMDDWLHWLFNLIAIAGLWGYLRRRPLGPRYFWMGYFGFAVLSLIYGAASLLQQPSEWRLAFALVFAIGTALTLPLLLALWRYSFGRSDIWRRTAVSGRGDR